MTDHSERIAVLEASQKRIQEDLDKLFKFQRDHMEREDERWEEIKEYMAKQKGTIGGIVLAISSIWAIISTVLFFWKN